MKGTPSEPVSLTRSTVTTTRSGGYGREELERSGAYRVYADPAEMLTRLEEVGVRPIR
jgi:hypothetical protein